MHQVELELPVAQEDHLAPEGVFLLQEDLQLEEKVLHHPHLEVDHLALEALHLEEGEVEVQGAQPVLKQVMVHLAVRREDHKEAPLAMDLRE